MNRFRNRYFCITATVFLALIVVLVCVDRPVKMEKRIAERIASGQAVPGAWYVEPWLWRALILNIGLAGLLVAATPLAARTLRGDFDRDLEVTRPFARWEWSALAGIILIAGIQNAPRLGQSLWGDEEYTMKRLIADQVERDADGRVVLEKATWSTALWSFKKPTNHIGYTVVARLFHDAFFKPGTGPADPWFSEWLIRLPVYIAGLLSIPALVWACGVWGFKDGAVLVAFGYSMHAWFVRFGVDARGYGFVLLLTPLIFACLGRAIQTGRWRWWLAFGFAQFYLFWTYFASVYLLAALNVTAALMIATLRDRAHSDRVTLGVRWAVANVVSAILVIAIMSPCLPQLFEFLSQKPLPGSFDAAWFADAACYLVSGLPWYPWDAANPLCVAWTHQPSWSLMFPFAAFVLATGATAGVVVGTRTLWRHPAKRWFLVVIFGAPLLMLAHQWQSQVRPYHWYLIPFLPGLLVLMAASMSRLKVADGERGVRPRLRPALAGVVLMVFVTFPVVTARERGTLCRHAIEPCRESVALTRAVTNPRHPDYDKDVITAGFTFYTEAYDPGLVRFENADGLRKLMQRADAEGKALFVNFGFREWAVEHHADVIALLDDPRYFEHTATLPGLFFTSTREVYRYKGGVTGR